MKRQRGIALLSVLLVMAAVTALATRLHLSHRSAISEVDDLMQWRQAWYFARTGEVMAAELLYQDWQDETSRAVDHLGENWARRDLALSLPLGELRFAITDAQSKLNVNGLQPGESPLNDPLQMAIPRLLERKSLPRRLYLDLIDWLDGNNLSRTEGRESELYRELGYQPGNRPLTDIGELRLLRSAGVATVELDNWLVALPVLTPININTMSPDIIGLFDPSSVRAASALERVQEAGGYASVAAFVQQPEGQRLAGLKDSLTVRSEWFEVTALLRYRDVRLHLHSVLHRDPGSGEVRVHSRFVKPWRDALPAPYAKL